MPSSSSGAQPTTKMMWCGPSSQVNYMALDVTITRELIDSLKKYPLARRKRILNELGHMEFSRCADSLHYWMDPNAHWVPYVYTYDQHPMFKCNLCPSDSDEVHHNFKRQFHLEHAHGRPNAGYEEIRQCFTELSTTRPFPSKEYFGTIATHWLQQPLMLVEKSRDMMATWMTITFYTWDTIFHGGRQNFFQSETAKKTRELVKRSLWIWQHQPRFIRDIHRFKFAIGVDGAGEFRSESLNSEIIGMPQGNDQIRQYHPSGVFTDETAFHEKASESFAAIKPSIQNGGRYTAVSTAFPSWFMLACGDVLENDT